MDWFLYDKGLRHERFNAFMRNVENDFSLNLFNVDINVQCSFQEKLIQTTKSYFKNL